MSYMHRGTMRALFVILAAGTMFWNGCSEDDNPTTPSKAGTFFGAAVTLGNGTARTYVTLDSDGKPLSVGVRMTESSMTGLPADPANAANTLVLALPAEASSTPFTHVLFNWNPMGHPPDDVYDSPHFDIHFYVITGNERLAINPADTVKGKKIPEAKYVPAGYFNGVDVVPMMGVHWIDGTAPELHGSAFTRTFIYGYWNGALAFIEPMITKAFIEARQTVTDPITQPASFQKSGSYPTTYTSRYDAGANEYVVSMDSFIAR